MAELIGENWPYLLLALLVGLAVAWWIFAAGRRTTITREDSAAGEGATKRNQALIDAAPAAAPPAAIQSDDPAIAAGASELTRIKGLGPKAATRLQELGITSLAQIAAWDEAEIDRIDSQLGPFAGRIRRDDWPTQARLLTEGDTAAYEAKYGKL